MQYRYLLSITKARDIRPPTSFPRKRESSVFGTNATGSPLSRGRRRYCAIQFGNLQQKAQMRLRASLSRFLFRCGIEARDAAAFRARLFVDDRVDQGRLAPA